MARLNLPLQDFYTVIPAGGIGSRLWPLSRAEAPKFLHDLTGSGSSLLRDTFDRLAPLSGDQRIMVVTGRAHRAAVEEQIGELADHNIVLESEPRDSSAAIALAAAILEKREPGVIIGSFAADHVIKGARFFNMAVAEAVEAARAGFIATIGIVPTEPAIGFGYIHATTDADIEGAGTALVVDNFVEKPNLATAEKYVASGDYLWNAGMFITKASVLLDELKKTQPELVEGVLALAEVWDDHAQRGPMVDKIWPKLTKIALDYSVAEPAAAAGRMVVIPGEFDWDDVGDFASIAKLHSSGHKNDLAILGEDARVLSDASSGIVITDTGRTIALVGVKDIVVVDTGDALLVTTTANAQKVKSVVDALRVAGRDDVL
jgi:mannose-1-phosphate guanylyltransferase